MFKLSVVVIALVMVGLGLLVIFPVPEPEVVQSEVLPEVQLVDCYVGGEVHSLEPNECLSLQQKMIEKEPVKEVQVRYVPQQQVPQAPVIKLDTSPNRYYDRECREFADGSVHCF